MTGREAIDRPERVDLCGARRFPWPTGSIDAAFRANYAASDLRVRAYSVLLGKTRLDLARATPADFEAARGYCVVQATVYGNEAAARLIAGVDEQELREWAAARTLERARDYETQEAVTHSHHYDGTEYARPLMIANRTKQHMLNLRPPSPRTSARTTTLDPVHLQKLDLLLHPLRNDLHVSPENTSQPRLHSQVRNRLRLTRHHAP